MPRGFLYLTAIIDVYSRYVVGWGISNTLDAACSLKVTKEAIARHGKPEIINSDRGSQFTCHEWIEFLEQEGIKISMDGKGGLLITSSSKGSGVLLNMTMFISRFLQMGWNFIRDLRSILIITITDFVIRISAIRSRQTCTGL
jgi:hypothetical protein